MKSQADMLDLVIDKLDLKNDAALAAAVDVSPAHISRMRAGKMPIGPSAMVRMHEATSLTIAELRTAAGLSPRMYITG